jgi:hypothetical protein
MKTERHGILCVACIDAKRHQANLLKTGMVLPFGRGRSRTNLPCLSVFIPCFSVILFSYYPFLNGDASSAIISICSTTASRSRIK